MAGSDVLLRNLGVSFGTTTVLAAIDLTVTAGESVAIMGPSGSGKSTLLGCVTGTVLPSTGHVQVGATEVSGLGVSARARFRRRHVGMMFQSPDLLPELTIAENVALTLLFDGVRRDDALSAALASLKALDMATHAEKRIDEISGGEAQRVALARALVRQEVELLVADEPTASLDARAAGVVTDLLLSRARSVGATVILATHDRNVAESCDRVVLLPQSNKAGKAA